MNEEYYFQRGIVCRCLRNHPTFCAFAKWRSAYMAGWWATENFLKEHPFLDKHSENFFVGFIIYMRLK